MQSSRLLLWSRYTYLIGLVLALVFIIPSVWFPLQLGKMAVFGIFLAISAILFVLGGGVREYFRTGGARSALLVLLIPVVYLISFYFSVDKTIGISGAAIDADSVLFMVLCAVAFLFAFVLFKAARTARVLLLVVAVVAAIAAIFQYIAVLFGPSVLSAAVFADRSVNLVGKWNDLGLLVTLGLMLLLLSLELVELTLVRRIAGIVVAAALALLLAIIQFPLVWGILLGFCLLLALWSFVTKRPAGEEAARGNTLALIPWIPLAGALVSVLLLLWGATVNTSLTSVFPVSALEVRPSFGSTLDIVRASHGTSIERFLFGTGPQTFGSDWLLNKPIAVNQSQFWNLDFSVGFSTFTTALASVGVMGVLVLLIPLILVILGLVRSLRSTHGQDERTTALYLSVASILLWCSALFYVPSQNLILLSFAMAGAAFGFSMKGRAQSDEVHAASSRIAQAGFGVVAIGLLVVVLWSGFLGARLFIAQVYTNKGAAALAANNVDSALAYAAKAQKIQPIIDSYRLAVVARGATIQKIVSVQSPTQDDQLRFKGEVEKIIPDARYVISAAPQDYRGYLSLAKIYDLLASLGVSGAYESAKDAYSHAAVLNPTDPEIPLDVARLEAVHSNAIAPIQTNLSRALTLKPDYTDAILFLVQLNVANKDIPNAIKAAQAAVKSAPGIPSIWFELGLLYYSANDMQNAMPVLEQAVKLQPDFANAKYFLGLAYASQNRMQDAVQQFVDLQKTNPDNKEVQLILSNLEAGKPPFTNARPPVTATPQDRTTAPISQ